MALWPIQLPYGLTNYYRYVQEKGKGVVLPGPPRFQILTREQLSSNSWRKTNIPPETSKPKTSSPPPLPKSSKSSKSSKSKKRRQKSSHDHKMGVAGSASRHSKTALLTAKAKRNKTPKPQSRCATTAQSADVAAKKKERKEKRKKKPKEPKPFGPGTQPGAHKQLPILIDSDDESDSADSVETSASAAIRAYRSSTFSSPVSRHDRAQTSAPPLHPAGNHDPKVYEERLVSVSTEPSTPVRMRNRPSYPAVQRYSGAQTVNIRPEYRRPHNRLKPNPPNSRVQQHVVAQPPSSPASSYADDGIVLTLADIQDFDLRQKTARLMAVTPGLPVADIYHLLMERRGHVEAAKQDVIRRSQQPPASSRTRRSLKSERAATVPLIAAVDVQQKVKDEPYIRIDFDDADFIWDRDAPAEPPSEPSRRKRSSQARLKKTASFPTAKPTQSTVEVVRPSGSAFASCRTGAVPRCPDTPSRSSAKEPTCLGTPSRATKVPKGHTTKRSKGKGTGDINRGMRETSYDRSFIVPDEEVLEDSDETYSESDEVDIGMTDDGTDLTIDMEPEYSYNSDILSSPTHR
ncbi:hypothetical protein N0V86_006514 [Didymella sp. IMI 355093]|nr:hypothetical protein N0V86_006514 [Didymella sp. IMI 355093]